MDWLLCHPSHMELAEWWTLCHPFGCGWWRKRTNLFCRVRSPNVRNRLKNLLETWMCLKGRMLIMKKWTFISHVLILLYLFSCLMKLIWWIDVIFFTDEVYEFVSCTNSSAGWSTQSHWVGPRQWMYKSHDWWQEYIDGCSLISIASEAYHLRWQRQKSGIGSM